MKFTCDLQLLSEVVGNVSLAISSKPTTIPALEGVLMQCRQGHLKLTGFDLDIGIYSSIEVQSQQDGAIVLNSQLLGEMLRKMEGPTVSIETDDRFMAHISDHKTNYHILGISHDEYPVVPEVDQSKGFEIPDPTLKSMIHQTLFAVAQNITQSPVLCGSMFEVKDKILKLASVDGYRVAVSQAEIESTENFKFVVPAKTLSEISKLLSDDKNKLTRIQISKRHSLFEIGGYQIVTRLLEGEFIDYASAIPQTIKTTIIADPNILIQSIERVSILVTNKTSVTMKVKQDETVLRCESTLGQVSDTVRLPIEGEPLDLIAFNNRYMIEALRHAGCDEVKIEMNGPVMPIKITPAQGDRFLFLVLPVRLKSE